MIQRRFTLPLLFLISAIAQPAFARGDFTAAADYSKTHGGLSLIIVQRGATILEQYTNGYRENDRHKIYSGTKSFWAVAAMDAVHDGILNLDEPVSSTLEEWRRSSDPRKSTITLRQVLNFTDGIEPAFKLHGDSIPDRNRYAISLPVSAQPGSSFIYGPSHLQIFCELFRRKLALRHETPCGYLKRKVLDPLRLGLLDYKKDAIGNPLLATGFQLTARQWLRFAQMVLHHGVYEGRTIIPADYLDTCFRGTAANPAFGIGFWLNREAASPNAREVDVEQTLELDWRRQDWSHACICRDAPPDLIVSLGSSFQRLYIIPSLDLIVVRQGVNAKFSDSHFLRLLLGKS